MIKKSTEGENYQDERTSNSIDNEELRNEDDAKKRQGGNNIYNSTIDNSNSTGKTKKIITTINENTKNDNKEKSTNINENRRENTTEVQNCIENTEAYQSYDTSVNKNNKLAARKNGIIDLQCKTRKIRKVFEEKKKGTTKYSQEQTQNEAKNSYA